MNIEKEEYIKNLKDGDLVYFKYNNRIEINRFKSIYENNNDKIKAYFDIDMKKAHEVILYTNYLITKEEMLNYIKD